MRVWRDRIYAAYGRPHGSGAEAVAEMDVAYRSIGDEQLTSLCRKYGVDYAVLFAGTPTSFEVLDHNDDYVLVNLGDCSVPTP